MRWKVKEIDTFLQAREYVDTALIPLIPISFKEEIKSTVAMGEFITIISDELERQFTGRVIQLPAFTYLKTEDKSSKEEKLRSWCKQLEEDGIKHIILLSSDYEWKSSEEDIEKRLIWLPTLPLESMDAKYQVQVIGDQIKQLIPILTDKWKSFNS